MRGEIGRWLGVLQRLSTARNYAESRTPPPSNDFNELHGFSSPLSLNDFNGLPITSPINDSARLAAGISIASDEWVQVLLVMSGYRYC